ncbi:MAG: hypothetical protein HZB35_02240 [Nitrospirae bacterium]|nr:hypothetical protein [Nitrospirota bacterium]
MEGVNEVLDAIGALVSSLKTYSAKLPSVVHLAAVPGGVKPLPEAIVVYEKTVYRFRDQSAGSTYRRLTDHFIESLESFETGDLLSAIQPLLTVLDHLERMHRDKEIGASSKDAERMKEYRLALHKIMPGSKPELAGAGKGL